MIRRYERENNLGVAIKVDRIQEECDVQINTIVCLDPGDLFASPEKFAPYFTRAKHHGIDKSPDHMYE